MAQAVGHVGRERSRDAQAEEPARKPVSLFTHAQSI
jgi:hypothetical protein